MYEWLNVTHPFKFNDIKIKLKEDGSFYFNYKFYALIQPVEQSDLLLTSAQGIIEKKLTLKE